MFAKFIGKRISATQIEPSKLYKSIMIGGGIVSYPCFLLKFFVDMEIDEINCYNRHPSVVDYIGMSIYALFPSILVGIATPAVVYSSVIWGPLYLLNKRSTNTKYITAL